MQGILFWRQYPELFRGAPGLIRRAWWWGTAELDQTHRLILRACDGEVGDSPAGNAGGDRALAPGDRTSYVRHV